MKRYVLAGFLAAASIAFGTPEVSPPGKVIFYRLGGDANNWRMPIKIDGMQVHKLGSLKRWEADLSPGSHVIVSRDKQYAVSLTVESGKTYYVRIDVVVGVFRGGAVRPVAVPSSVAEGETAGLKSDN